MARYDGSIKFDTKIDEDGFNDGLSNLGDKSKKFFSSVAAGLAQGAALAIAGVFAVLKVVDTIFTAVGRFVKGLINGVKKLVEIGSKTEALKTEFENLKLSVSNAFLPLLNVALPLLQKVASWLTKIFNLIGMVIGALLGQKTVMRAVADTAASAAGSTGKMADNSKKAEKAAKGALAAFDDINVLQMEEPTQETDTGSGGGAGGTGFELVPIAEQIMSWAEKVRAFLEPLKQPLNDIWQGFKNLYSVVAEALQPLWEELGISAGNVLVWLRDLAINGIQWLTEKIGELTTWVQQNPEEFRAWVKALIVVGSLLVALFVTPILGGLAAIGVALGLLGAVFTGFVLLVKVLITGEWRELWQMAKTAVMQVLYNLGEEIWNFLYGIGEGFYTTWINIRNSAINAFLDIKLFIKGIINDIIGFMNALIRGVVNGMNSMIGALNGINFVVPDWVPLLGGSSFGLNIPNISAPQIPKLATGAVIPPNSQFLAVLGDQKSGNNIEAPEGLIRQIVSEELADLLGNEEININMPVFLDSEKIYDGQKRVQRRRGASLVTGGGVA